ncbi:hypothetical protein RFI_00611 [Reticulomyxa filosa]|uniref:Uncharacterized protein n=1 Tax=Reticulomyxa filosa TaxID=46433 RepID=X6PEJ6_RETFI|nr:hypothetical protein RFI_00611 [Reticulomyxa filosa]|eukprot:ETO36454.1 hypothetical protein RFI_00611 [Reticulomyxa filosa]
MCWSCDGSKIWVGLANGKMGCFSVESGRDDGVVAHIDFHMKTPICWCQCVQYHAHLDDPCKHESIATHSLAWTHHDHDHGNSNSSDKSNVPITDHPKTNSESIKTLDKSFLHLNDEFLSLCHSHLANSAINNNNNNDDDDEIKRSDASARKDNSVSEIGRTLCLHLSQMCCVECQMAENKNLLEKVVKNLINYTNESNGNDNALKTDWVLKDDENKQTLKWNEILTFDQDSHRKCNDNHNTKDCSKANDKKKHEQRGAHLTSFRYKDNTNILLNRIPSLPNNCKIDFRFKSNNNHLKLSYWMQKKKAPPLSQKNQIQSLSILVTVGENNQIKFHALSQFCIAKVDVCEILGTQSIRVDHAALTDDFRYLSLVIEDTDTHQWSIQGIHTPILNARRDEIAVLCHHGQSIEFLLDELGRIDKQLKDRWNHGTRNVQSKVESLESEMEKFYSCTHDWRFELKHLLSTGYFHCVLHVIIANK